MFGPERYYEDQRSNVFGWGKKVGSLEGKCAKRGTPMPLRAWTVLCCHRGQRVGLGWTIGSTAPQGRKGVAQPGLTSPLPPILGPQTLHLLSFSPPCCLPLPVVPAGQSPSYLRHYSCSQRPSSPQKPSCPWWLLSSSTRSFSIYIT